MRGRAAGLTAAGVIVAIAVGVVVFAARRRAAAQPVFVGAATCAKCHAKEFAAWEGSQHAVAMQTARPATVLGRFDSTHFAQGTIASTFFRRGDRFYVNTQGFDGRQHDYPVAYTFGVYPLQQYLVELAGGHVQALSLAWDARPAAQGGQRWFSLTPGQEIAHTDEYFWTGAQYNWNYMCADCHSTAVRKGYDARTGQFHTTFSEMDVACEACHGPGSTHAAWGAYPTWLRVAWRTDGLPAQLTERVGVRWPIDSATGNPTRSRPRTTDREIETCAQCHARRSHIADGYTAGKRFLDYYTPLLLVPGLYYPDGQQLDEVYTYASFLQSRMYHAGVTCSDCHDPHTSALRRPGNGVCTQCHLAAKYDTTAHHFHPAKSPGAMCVSCHMPPTTYMQVDPRHDHSIRIPRPDLSVSLGGNLPNACNRCHTDHDAQWAAAEIRARYPTPNPGFQRFAGAFATDEVGGAGAADSLAAVAHDATQPAIVRASALARLEAHPGPIAVGASKASAGDPNGLVRHAAVQILETAPPEQRAAIAVPLLGDSTRSVRQEAASVLAPVASTLPVSAKGAFNAAAAEFIASQQYNADRAPSRLALGTFFAELGRYDDAAAQLRAALQLSPSLTQAYVDLAYVQRAQGHMSDAIATLVDARARNPRDDDLLLALAAFSRDAGDTTSALRYARMLLAAHPSDSTARALVRSLSR